MMLWNLTYANGYTETVKGGVSEKNIWVEYADYYDENNDGPFELVSVECRGWYD